VKKTRRGKSIMGTTQRNYLCSYLYHKPAKCPVSHFVYYVFSSTKLENKKGEWGVAWERDRRMNMVQTMYTHECK
jgi:hypothetical protein